MEWRAMKRMTLSVVLSLVCCALGAIPSVPAGAVVPGQAGCPPANWGDSCSAWYEFEPGEKVKVCLAYDEVPAGWVRVVWYLQESGCRGSECTSTWTPNRQEALFEYRGHRVWLNTNQAPSGDGCYAGACYVDGSASELYQMPSSSCCAGCSQWDGRAQCISESGQVYAPRGDWHQTKVLESSWAVSQESCTVAGTTYHLVRWQETWPAADGQSGQWSFAEDDTCFSQPGMPSPTPGAGGGPTPTPEVPCVPGDCYPLCSFAQLQLNGQPAGSDPPGVALGEGPLTISFKTPKPGGCPEGWNYLKLVVYPELGGPPVVLVTARERPGECGEGEMQVEWSDGRSGCLGWGAWASNTFGYLRAGGYRVEGVLQRLQCGIGFTTDCTWYFGLGGVPTATATLEARVEYWSEHDPDYPERGPGHPYRTLGSVMSWNYGEVLHAHPSAGWEEPEFPGWRARTAIVQWRYLGSTTTSYHAARCVPEWASSCDWQGEVPRAYVHLRWYKYLMADEVEGVCDESFPPPWGCEREWVYASAPMRVSFTYQVRAETEWTPLGGGTAIVLPFTETLTMSVDLKYLVTYR